MPTKIPVYRADGRLYDRVSERGLARLQEAGLIARVVRRKGHINRAILVLRPGEEPMRRTVYLGTRYSYLERLERGFCWDLKRLGGARSGTNYAPDEVRPVFFRVIADCLSLADHHRPAAPASSGWVWNGFSDTLLPLRTSSGSSERPRGGG